MRKAGVLCSLALGVVVAGGDDIDLDVVVTALPPTKLRICPENAAATMKTVFIWQRGGRDMNIWSGKKRLEKLTSMHNNPVKRGWVPEPGDWARSSWRYHDREDGSILPMDKTS